MSTNDRNLQQISKKPTLEQKLELPEENPETNGHAESKHSPTTETSLSDGVEPAPAAPGPVNGDFPEGGARAWSVVGGATGIIFCSLGYCNAFG